jgi:hypothetical protein
MGVSGRLFRLRRYRPLTPQAESLLPPNNYGYLQTFYWEVAEVNKWEIAGVNGRLFRLRRYRPLTPQAESLLTPNNFG